MEVKAEDKIIQEIHVQGLQTLKEKAVRKDVTSKIGDVYSEDKVQKDVEALYNTGKFEEVTLETQEMPLKKPVPDSTGVRVIFKVTEKPILRRIDFKGNKKFSRRRFLSDLVSKEGEPYDSFKTHEDVEKITTLYKDKGYADVTVENYTSKDPKTGKIVLTFYVTEGNRIRIDQVTLEGVSAFPEKKLKKLIKTKRKKVYKEETIQEDLKKLELFYKNRGYIKAKIGEPKVVFNAERTGMTIAIPIEEGRQFHIGTFSFEGNTVFPEADLRKQITLKPGKLFAQDQLDESVHNIQSQYADKGYLRAQVQPDLQEDAEAGVLNTQFKIVESGVVFVDRIYVDGNTSTKDYVLLREVLLKPGEPFNASKVRRSAERMYNLGFLDDVQIDVQQPREPDKADIVFEVTEGKPGILSAGAGFSSVDGLLGTLQLQHINLFGRAQRLNLLWEFGRRRQNYELGWTTPWFMGKPVSVGTDIFNTIRRRQFGTEVDAFKERRRGGDVRVGPRLNDYYSLLFTYAYEEVKIFDLSPTLVLPSDILIGQNVTSSLTSQIIRDSRDNVFDATKGSRNSAAVQVAGGPFGGNVHFYKPGVKSTVFFPTFWKFVFSLNMQHDMIKEFAPSKNVPINELFLLGGADTVRGYDFTEVGARNGGKVRSIFNAEYKFPIVQEHGRSILQGAFFADVGGAWTSVNTVNYKIGNEEDQMKAGIGFGIRFKTPVFPIRLDWGYGLNHRAGEQLTQFYFTIGNIF